jgi:hypothetical protein
MYLISTIRARGEYDRSVEDAFFSMAPGACFTKELTITIKFYPANLGIFENSFDSFKKNLDRYNIELNKFKWNN